MESYTTQTRETEQSIVDMDKSTKNAPCACVDSSLHASLLNKLNIAMQSPSNEEIETKNVKRNTHESGVRSTQHAANLLVLASNKPESKLVNSARISTTTEPIPIPDQ